MNLDARPHEWPTVFRLWLAAAAGLAWALLWFGLSSISLAGPWFAWFTVGTIVLFAPVLAVLGRGRWDLILLLFVAFVVSFAAALGLSTTRAGSGSLTLELARGMASRAAIAWIPAWAAAGLLFVFLAARRRARPTPGLV